MCVFGARKDTHTHEPETHAETISRNAILLGALFLGSALSSAQAVHDDSREERDRGGYVFATTRGPSAMDVHAAPKVPISPVPVVLEIVFVPFALIAGGMTRGTDARREDSWQPSALKTALEACAS